MDAYLSRIRQLVESLLILTLLGMVLLTFADVIGRRLFGTPVFGAHDATEHLMAIMVFCGLPLLTAGFYSKGVLVLQGPQSIGKTPWVANLLPDTFADYVHLGMHLDPSNRDSVKTAVSHWIVELGEVDSTMNRADVAMLNGEAGACSCRTIKV